MTKGDYAAHRGVSASRLSQLISSGQLPAEALVGDGRRALVNVPIADRLLGLNLSLSHRLGQSGSRKSESVAAAPVNIDTGRYQRAKAEQAEMANERERRKMRTEDGLYIETAAARAAWAKELADLVQTIEGVAARLGRRRPRGRRGVDRRDRIDSHPEGSHRRRPRRVERLPDACRRSRPPRVRGRAGTGGRDSRSRRGGGLIPMPFDGIAFLANPVRETRVTMAAVLTPPPPVDHLRWAEKHVRFGTESPLKGSHDRSKFPFFDRIYKVLGPDHPARVVVLCKSAQLDGTVLAQIFIASQLDTAPGPVLYTHPTEGNAKRWVRTKWRPMIRATSALSRIIPLTSAKEGTASTLYQERFDGRGYLQISGANSAASLSMVSMPTQVQDDLSKWETNEAGDPEIQADSRSKAYEWAKIFKVGTPLFAGQLPDHPPLSPRHPGILGDAVPPLRRATRLRVGELSLRCRRCDDGAFSLPVLLA